MILAELIGKELKGIGGSLRTLELEFDSVVLKIYPDTKRAGVKPEIAWIIVEKRVVKG